MAIKAKTHKDTHKMEPGPQAPPKTPGFKRVNFSRKRLAIFIAIFAVIGGYTIFHTFAATSVVATVQAEQMTLPAGASVVNDTTANGGQAARFTQNGNATSALSLLNTANSVTVIAKGSKCKGSYSSFSVTIDGASVRGNTKVGSKWTEYNSTVNLNSGMHNITLNASNATSCRLLYVDVAIFYGVTPPPTPVPTVSLSASPSSVTAGSASTLTWSSTDATSCSASGAWSGSQPTVGSTSTGALNADSTYTLACTGEGGSASASTTVLVTSPPPPTGSCDFYASPTGSDTNPGSSSSPVKTVNKLVTLLSAGHTGCLNAGTYSGTVDVPITLNGTSDTSRVTITSVDGVRAKIDGNVTVRGNFVTLKNVDIDGYNWSQNTLRVFSNNVVFSNLDVTNRNKPNGTSNYSANCVIVGYINGGLLVQDLLIEKSRIHNCGDDNHEHSIYLEHSRRAIIRDNYLYGNYGYGISMYPDAQGSIIEYNVIDGNSISNRANLTFSGEKSGGEYTQPYGSINNTVRYNIITNAVTRYNVDSYYPSGALAPSGNVVSDSCVWNAPFGNFGHSNSAGGTDYTTSNIKDVDPLYVNRGAKDFSLSSSSPCTGWGPRQKPAM